MGVMTKGLEVVKIRLVKEEPLMSDRYVTCPEDAVQVLSDELAEIDREVFAVLNFNTDGSVINMNIVSVGTLNSSMAYPREVFKSSIFSTFPVLHAAYELKEMYRKFNRLNDYDEACSLFPRIKKFFADSGIEEYNEFTGLLYRWDTEILNSFIRPYEDNRRLSNSYTENINGKIRTYINVSRGIKNFDRFRKRVIYALNPDISYALTSKLHSEKYKGKARGPYEKTYD